MTDPKLEFSQYLDSLSNLGIEPSLDGSQALCAALGDPQKDFPAIQITGTNGKTSVARMVGALLEAHDISTGVYTSPHLQSYRERILLREREIGVREFASLGEQVHEAIGQLERSRTAAEQPPRRITQFEAITGAALRAFADADLDVAVLEVGMGGRWDATSVVRPTVSVVTNVTMDHAEWLGPELTDIAAEKSYVIKEGTVGVIGNVDSTVEAVLADRARDVVARLVRVGRDCSLRHGPDGLELSTPYARYKKVEVGPAGQWQAENALLATVAAEAFIGSALNETAVRRGLARVVCPGRAELISGTPDILLDGAHNPAGVRALAQFVRTNHAGRNVALLVAILRDKAAPEMVATLAELGRLVFVPVNNPRGMNAGELCDIATAQGIDSVAASSIEAALETARSAAGAQGLVVAAGSFYLVGRLRSLLVGSEPT